jgi:hypothetical protein
MTALCCDVRRVVRQVLRIDFHDFGTGCDFKGGGIGLSWVYFFDGVRDGCEISAKYFGRVYFQTLPATPANNIPYNSVYTAQWHSDFASGTVTSPLRGIYGILRYYFRG